MNKARITYRFDRDKDQFDQLHAADKENKQGTSSDSLDDKTTDTPVGNDRVFDSQLLNQFTTDYGAWSSPFDIETERLEKIIRESGADEPDERTRDDRREPSKRRKPDFDDGFGRWTEEWSEYAPGRDEPSAEDKEGPFIIEDAERSSYSAVSYRPGQTSWFRITASLFGAIVTGVLLGLFILQLFADIAMDPGAPLDAPIAQPDTNESAAPVDEASGSFEEGAIAVNVPQQTVYMLQFGVFSTLDGARAAQEQLRQAGIASAYEEAADRHVVYAGLTPDRNSALLLSNQLEQMNLETYVKPFERAAVSELKWGDADSAAVESFFSEGAQLARTVSLLTLVHLEETELTNFEDATIQALTASHQQWTITANRIAGEVPDNGEPVWEQMNNELTTAVNSLLEYKKNPSLSYLWQAQTAVMNYVIQEKNLLQQLAV